MHFNIARFALKATAAACLLALGNQAYSAMSSDEMIIVHPFQWTYDNIAKECTEVLGPNGFDGVQIPQPAEHINRSDVWWALYQPINYNNFTTMAGNETQLRNMIKTCNKAGVKVFADAVFNQRGNTQVDGKFQGIGGSYFNPSEPWYPDSDSSNYHQDCSSSINYGDASSVRKCRLNGMPDVATDREATRQIIANYLKSLLDMGVYGFRIDAAKHMYPDDIASILGKVGNPAAYLEVIGAYGEAVQPTEYTYINNSVVTEFQYCNAMLKNIDQPKYLLTLGDSWFQLKGDQSEVFVLNHDNERGSAGTSYLNYKYGQKYNLAQSFLVAYPHGKIRQVYSGYQFDTHDQAGPLSADRCTGGWNCDHRNSIVLNAVGFARATRGYSVTSSGNDGDKLIWFNRGPKGFYALNANSYEVTREFDVELPDGQYCEILQQSDKCGGQQIVVANKKATVKIPAMSAAAMCVGDYCGGSVTPCEETNTCPSYEFDNLYFAGTTNSWKHQAMTLSDDKSFWYIDLNLTGLGDSSGSQRFKVTTTPDWKGDVYGTNGSDTLCSSQATCGDVKISQVGNYRIKVTNDTRAPVYSVELISSENVAPVAAFSSSVDELTVKFTNKSTDKNGDALTYVWDFGDGSTTSETNPEHTYSAKGTYQVTLVANDGQSDSNVESQSVVVGSVCAKNLSALYYAGTTNNWTHDAMTYNNETCKWEIALTLTGESDANNGPRFKVTSTPNWKGTVWGKKSGNTLCSNQSSCGDVSYTEVGNYVLAIDDSSMTWSLNKAGNTAPVAQFALATDGLTITTSNTSYDEDGDTLTYTWDFGDGNTSNDKTAQHTYDVDGIYTVTLTVSDGQSEVTVSEDVEVAQISCQANNNAMYYAGTTNSWKHEAMKLNTSTCQWYIDLELTGNGDSAGAQRFKVTSTPNWNGTVWGDAKYDNKLCSNQSQCPDVYINEVGSYRLSVDDNTMVWSLEAK